MFLMGTDDDADFWVGLGQGLFLLKLFGADIEAP